MALIKDNKYINNIIKITQNYYSNIFNEKVGKVNIFCTDNMVKDVSLFTNNISGLIESNGLFIEPNIINNIPTILINYKQFLYEFPDSAIATILHELTHVSDYQKFIKEYCNNNWINIRDNSIFPAFYFWSEYHARITEILHMRIAISNIDKNYIYDENQVKIEMLEYQLPMYNKEIENLIENNNANIKDIFKYCARFYCCEVFNDDIFLIDYIPINSYKSPVNIIKLYDFLKPLQTYEKATNYFSSLNEILLNGF